MPVQHLGKEITVTLSDDAMRLPRWFKLAGKEHQVAEILATWQDHGYSGLPATRRGWQGGSQRQFYRLRTTTGETFEIYVETPVRSRGSAQKGRWYAWRRLTGAAVPEATSSFPETHSERSSG